MRTKFGPKLPSKRLLRRAQRPIKKKKTKKHKLHRSIWGADSSSEDLADYDEPPLPIYYDPYSGKYYYPRETIHEIIPITRDLDIQNPGFSYDKPSKLYYNEQTGDVYLQVEDPTEIRQKRLENLERLKREEAQKIASQSAIYKNKTTQKYLYPITALADDPEIKRETLSVTKIPVKFDPVSRNYIHKKTKEVYLEIENREDFDHLRAEMFKMIQEDQREAFAALTFIYIDPDSNVLFYPKSATEEARLLKRYVTLILQNKSYISVTRYVHTCYANVAEQRLHVTKRDTHICLLRNVTLMLQNTTSCRRCLNLCRSRLFFRSHKPVF